MRKMLRIYHRYRIALKPIVWLLIALLGIQLGSWLFPPLTGIKGIASYVPLHTLLELIGIVISMLVFTVIWSSYDKEHSRNFQILAYTFVGVAILDFLHAISYQGMPTFITASSPEKAIDFWLMARMFSAFGLLAVSFLSWHTSCTHCMRWVVLPAVLLVTMLLAWLIILHPEWTPDTFIPGQGLTTFKVVVEFIIITLFLFAAFRFLLQMRSPQPYDVIGLFAAVCVMALSEVFFTLYADVTDIFNLLGHIYKVIAYGFIYQSIFLDRVRLPYQRLYESRNLLQSVIESIPLCVFWKDRDFHYIGCNTLFAKDAGETGPEQVVNKLDTQLAWQKYAEIYHKDDQQIIQSATAKMDYEEPLITSEGKRRWLRTSKAPLYNMANDVIGVLGVYEDITEQRDVQHELQFLQSAITSCKSAFFKINRHGMVLYVNQAACDSLGYLYDELIGKFVWEFDPDFSTDIWDTTWRDIKQTEILQFEGRHQRKDGVIFPVEITGNYIVADGEEYIFSFTNDISERKQAEQTQTKLTRSLMMLSKCNSLLIHAQKEKDILKNICQLVVKAGGYKMAWVGYKEYDEIKSVRPVAQFGFEQSYLDRIKITWDDSVFGQGPTGRAINTGDTIVNQNCQSNPTMEIWRDEAVKRGYQSSIALPLISNDQVMGALSIYSTESNSFVKEEIGLLEELASDLAFGVQTLRLRKAQQVAEKKIEFLAYHDLLTGLPNRLLLFDRFEQAKALACREQSSVAILFLDLDNFKHINDSLGHAVGDQLLVKASKKIQSCLRHSDTLCRQGGDEFIALLTNMGGFSAIDKVAQKILGIFSAPFSIDDHVLYISSSIGISIFPGDDELFEILVQKADTALYQAKLAGKNTYRFFSEQMNIDAAENMQLQSQLHHALNNQELFLHYQPQIDTKSGCVTGAEALLRWDHPERGMVSPAKFIPLAERSGLIIPIGEWVLNEACKQAYAWREIKGLESMTIAVNLSALQFKRGDIVESVTNALSESGLSPSQLELELTESILLDDLDVVKDMLLKLKKVGVKLSIDDFGTGYSSLAYLKQLAVDKLKVDQSFVSDMVENSGDAAIVQAIIELGHTLQLTVIAEGVENDGQLSILKEYGCDEIQGYLFGRPCRAEEFLDFCK